MNSFLNSGDHDLMANFRGTLAWIKTLNSSMVDEWEPWWADGQVAGYALGLKLVFPVVIH